MKVPVSLSDDFRLALLRVRILKDRDRPYYRAVVQVFANYYDARERYS